MSPLILHHNQQSSHHILQQSHLDQQHQHAASLVANAVEYSTQQQLKPTGLIGETVGNSSTNTKRGKFTILAYMGSHRQSHTSAAAHRLSGNKKPTASGWKKPIVSSSSSALSSVVGSSSPDESSTADPVILSSSFETASDSSSPDTTVGVDMEELLELASKKTTPLSLKEMYKYAIVDADNREQRIRNARFLHSELPVRIAQRAVDLLTLPHGLNEIPAVLQVAHVYLLYLEKFQDCPVPTDEKSEDLFTDMLQSMVLERSSIPNAIAQGVDAWMQSEKEIAAGIEAIKNEKDSGDDETQNKRTRRLKEMEEALYRFFTARVGLRFLTEHHILSSSNRTENQLQESMLDDISGMGIAEDSFSGCIEPNCCPTREVRKVVEAVRRQTMEYYGDGICPEIQIVDGDIAAQQQQQNHKNRQGSHNNFTYVPHHLHYMVGELLKNSCRATVKRHIASGSTDKIPPIKIVIVKGAEDVSIKIADHGGGIPRSQMAEIWRFAHSTAAKDEIENETDFGVDEITGAAIRGFGLPLARIYARYLGGEITLKSLEGYGLDAYLHLPRLGNNCENLPLPVRFSPSNLNSNPLRTSDFRTERNFVDR